MKKRGYRDENSTIPHRGKSKVTSFLNPQSMTWKDILPSIEIDGGSWTTSSYATDDRMLVARPSSTYDIGDWIWHHSRRHGSKLEDSSNICFTNLTAFQRKQSRESCAEKQT